MHVPPVPNRIHDLVIAQYAHDAPADPARLGAEARHEPVNVPRVRPAIDDIARLHEDGVVARPCRLSVGREDAGELEDFLGVSEV